MLNCPNWSEAIELILSNNLPVKFALRGSLTLNDITQENFFATKKIWKHVRRLFQIFQDNCSARKPIFLCNFTNYEKERTQSNISVKSLDLNNPNVQVAPINLSYDRGWVSINRRPFDPFLPEYLRLLRESLEVMIIFFWNRHNYY